MENKRDIIYELIDHLGGEECHSLVLMELIKSMTTDQIVEFVEYFTDNHNVTIPGYEEYELCMDCQDTYESNDRHECTQPPQGSNKFFSSLIPEC